VYWLWLLRARDQLGVLALLAACGVLAACAGGNGEEAAAPNPKPDACAEDLGDTTPALPEKELPALAFAAVQEHGDLDLYVVPKAGAPPAKIASSPKLDEYSPTWSPDGTRLAYRQNPRGEHASDIWVMNADGSGKTNLTTTPDATEWSPAWSPDGKTIAYHGPSSGAGVGDLYLMRPDGSGKRNLTNEKTLGRSNEYPTWSPDSRRITFISYGSEGNFEIWVINVDGTCRKQLTDNPAADEWPAWSPDGSRIAFMTNRDGNYEIYTMSPDGSNLVNVTNTSNLHEDFPAWTPDGRLVFTRRPERQRSERALDSDGRRSVSPAPPRLSRPRSAGCVSSGLTSLGSESSAQGG
jgi:Tol biopolymer transport system component